MNILVAAFAYNERPYIPYMVEYYRSQGCDLLILDNYSTDGTYEWLVENNVRTGRVDTKDSFHLAKLQAELSKEIAKIKPDWVVYTGIDAYYFFEGTIREEIEKADAAGHNSIEVKHIEVHNTGEIFKLPFPENYFYMAGPFGKGLRMIAKYAYTIKIHADEIRVSMASVYKSTGFFINYGFCKPREERELTYARRQKAWTLGEDRGHGVHYRPAQERNWVWTKPEFTDIRTTEYYKMMTK
jgi:hypothetical protein